MLASGSVALNCLCAPVRRLSGEAGSRWGAYIKALLLATNLGQNQPAALSDCLVQLQQQIYRQKSPVHGGERRPKAPGAPGTDRWHSTFHFSVFSKDSRRLHGSNERHCFHGQRFFNVSSFPVVPYKEVGVKGSKHSRQIKNIDQSL